LFTFAGNAKPTGRAGLRRCRRGIKRLARRKASDQVKLRLKRDKRELDVTITAGRRPADFGKM
jgi:hypothetical protein